MGHSRRLRILVVHNRDFAAADDPEFASRADVENAARDVARALAARGHTVETLAVPPDAARRRRRSSPTSSRARPTWSSTCASRSPATRATRRCCRRCSSSPACATPARARSRSATALRKDRTKALLRARGVPTPARRRQRRRHAAAPTLPPLPCIVKPAREDASAGIWLRSVVHDAARARRARRRGARALPPAGAGRAVHRRAASSTCRSSATARARRAADARGRLLGDARRRAAHRHLRRQVGPGVARVQGHALGARRASRPRSRARCADGRARRLLRARAVATTRASICASPPTARPTSSTSTPTAISPTAPASAARPRSAGSPIPI